MKSETLNFDIGLKKTAVLSCQANLRYLKKARIYE